MIRFAWHTLLQDGREALEAEFPGTFGEYTIGGHFEHCVEIVRQALVCFADATLGPMMGEDGRISEAGIATGWGALHTCKNFDSLVSWVDGQESVHDEDVIEPGALPGMPLS